MKLKRYKYTRKDRSAPIFIIKHAKFEKHILFLRLYCGRPKEDPCTLHKSRVYRGCFSVRFPFSLGVSTTPRAGRVGGSAAASRAKLPQQMLCRRVECAVVAHQRHAHIGKAENLQHGIMDTMGALKRNEQ